MKIVTSLNGARPLGKTTVAASRASRCVLNIDNGRDIGKKVSHLIFKGGLSSGNTEHPQAIWCGKSFCWLGDVFRGQSKGPDNTLRLHQVKALGFYHKSPLLHKQPQVSWPKLRESSDWSPVKCSDVLFLSTLDENDDRVLSSPSRTGCDWRGNL